MGLKEFLQFHSPLIISMAVEVASKQHCAICFDVLHHRLGLSRGAHNGYKDGASEEGAMTAYRLGSSVAELRCPMFVTWTKREEGDDDENSRESKTLTWSLRGCIGTFSERRLLHGLREYAGISAFRDSRFKPIRAEEVSRLRCAVSLLTNFTTARHPHDWEVGVHGITIAFTVGRREYSATYLPEVAREMGWDHAQTLSSLTSKAGYKFALTDDLKRKMKVTRYESSKCSLTYLEYVALKKTLHGTSPATPLQVASSSAKTESTSEQADIDA